MTEPNTLDEQIDEILKKAWEHGYYSNNYPSDPNMTWFSDDKQQLKALFTEHSKQAFKKGYIEGGMAEILSHEQARKVVEAQFKRNKGEDNE